MEKRHTHLTLPQLRIRTEYSFRQAFGPLERCLQNSTGPAAIVDRNGTWGHVQWQQQCQRQGRKPIFGVELCWTANVERVRNPATLVVVLARTQQGLIELYELVSSATEQFYYIPRISSSDLLAISEECWVLIDVCHQLDQLPTRHPNQLMMLTPNTPLSQLHWAQQGKWPLVAASDNFYPAAQDRKIYEILAGDKFEHRTTQSHLLSAQEWLTYWPAERRSIQLANDVADQCNAQLPKAEMVHPIIQYTLEQQCQQGAKYRGINLKDKTYASRLKYELQLIRQKQFEDYFYVIAEMIQWAKQYMLVGPARGSSCGSLVCYLLRITEIDPLPYGLLFERFIDLNRSDLPDIDIDFPDNKRDMVFDHLINLYGRQCVARLGTISRYKAKSAITDVSKTLSIPLWEVQELKDSIIERSTGDARAGFCIADTFEQLDVGRRTLEKYPALIISADLENHARHSGQHAAGVIITQHAITNYCSVDQKTGCAMIDKRDAEPLNLLKIDALGLRTLSVIEDCLTQVDKSFSWMYNYPTDDKKAFATLQQHRFAGIFQFEGFALQSITRDICITEIEDLISLTALARPGPLVSGGTKEFTMRKQGISPIKYNHPSIKNILGLTYGIVIYQEQVMQIARQMGQLSWEDVSALRKAMSKSMGKEFFDRYWEKFLQGAIAQGIDPTDAKNCWNQINTMGSWSFNRSHAVAYGMLSYWCLVLKSHYPLEFAAACLRNAKDDDQCIQLLRELVQEGYQYISKDAQLSQINWTVQQGKLIGSLLGIKGIGTVMAAEIVQRRISQQPLTSRQQKLLTDGQTPWDDLYPTRTRWKHLFEHPEQYKIHTPISEIGQLTAEQEGRYLIIGQMVERNLRDHNELINLQKRGGQIVEGQSKYLNLTIKDDTGNIICTVGKNIYLLVGKPLIEEHKMGCWLMVRGWVKKGYRKIYIDRIRVLEDADEHSSST